MKISKYSALSILLIVVFLAGSAFARERINTVPSLLKTAVASTGQFDGNRVRDDLENNGMVVSHRISGHSGMEWPKDNNTYTVYASGVWLAGTVGGQIRTAVAEYAPERVPGPYGSDQSDGSYKLYKVSKTDLADPLANDDFQNWPVDLGAPWVDADGDGTYNPLPLGPDSPDFIGDQVIWYVSNDSDPTSHSIFSTAPMGVEVQTTIFGFDRPDAFGDMMFVKELIINMGEETINNMYIGVWSDPDLGDAGDDFVGCDTVLSMGICYNDGGDVDFAGYSGGVPAVGYDFFQGPIAPSVGDTAFANGKYIPDYKNLPMTSFTKYINSDDPVWSDPNDATEMYNLMKGLMKSGAPFDATLTGGSAFVHPGDPSLDTGPTDTEYVDWDVHSSDDRRFLMNSGPFTMAPGDSQEVVFGIMMAAAGGALESYQYLKEVDALAQLAYDIQFALPASPPSPEVTVTPLEESIILTWDDAAEFYKVTDVIDKMPVPESYDTTFVTLVTPVISIVDTVIVGTDTTITYDTSYVWTQEVESIDTTFAGENTTFYFEGYNVYQMETLAGSGAVKRIATFDLVNGIDEIYDDVFDADRGETINRRVQFGSDSGIKRYLEIDQDALNNNIPLKTNRAYYFTVTAYGYNPYGIPKTLESSMKIFPVRPQKPTIWTANDSTVAHGGTIATTTHTAGTSDGYITVNVIDPTQLTGDDYTVEFYTQHYYRDVDGLWKYTNYPDSVGKSLAKVLDCSGSDISVAALASSTVGTIDLTFSFGMDCGSNWVDGIQIDLPDALTINSWDAVGDCSYLDYGQNCVNMTGTLDATTNTITWGDSARSTFGAIEGGATFVVNIASDNVTFPMTIPYQVWDDGYDGTIADATGNATAAELGYEFKSLMYWGVSNDNSGEMVIAEQTTQSGATADRIIDGVFYAADNSIGTDAEPIAEGFQVQMTGAPNDLKWVGVTANAAGPVDPPVDGMPYWAFPDWLIADGDYTGQQSTNDDATWLLNVGPQYGTDVDAWNAAVVVYTGGLSNPNGTGIQNLIPDDFEIRFTGNGKAFCYWTDETVVDVPFEWWNIGDPNDPADDFQMIAWLLDEDENGIWNLQVGTDPVYADDPSGADHGTSGGTNDPWTDRVYVYQPIDDTPGTQGHDNFMAAVTADPSGVGAWYDGSPGAASGAYDVMTAFSRTTFMLWNGGEVTTATSPADYIMEEPETGTVFRIATTKPNSISDKFAFSTFTGKGDDIEYSKDDINVWPNPYFGYNPEERNPVESQIHFTHLPEAGKCVIRIFDLAGTPVKRIDHTDAGTQYVVWDCTNNYDIPVASGMYIAHVETDAGEKILKVAIIMPEQRLDVY